MNNVCCIVDCIVMVMLMMMMMGCVVNRSKQSVADVQKQVDEVTDVMRDNIDLALSNQEKASELVDKTGLLHICLHSYRYV